MHPTQITFEKTSEPEKSVAKIINSINDTKDCNKSRASIDFSQALKKEAVEELINVNIAKGVIRIKTFKITYLKEYVKIKFNKFIEIKLLSNPSKEKTFKDEVLVITLFNFNINCEKLMLQLKIFSPTSRIASEISEFKFIICSHKKYEELDKIAKTNNLNRN